MWRLVSSLSFYFFETVLVRNCIHFIFQRLKEVSIFLSKWKAQFNPSSGLWVNRWHWNLEPRATASGAKQAPVLVDKSGKHAPWAEACSHGWFDDGHQCSPCQQEPLTFQDTKRQRPQAESNGFIAVTRHDAPSRNGQANNSGAPIQSLDLSAGEFRGRLKRDRSRGAQWNSWNSRSGITRYPPC